MVLNVDSIGINYHDGAVVSGAIADCTVYKKKLKINDVLYILKITVYMKKEYSDVKKLKILKDN